MKLKIICTLLAIMYLPHTAIATNHVSKYVGQEKREIKSLSPDDIEELGSGGGWGLAKAAELNGFPGPVHILEMEDKINLTNEQKNRILNLYADMKANAINLGTRLIELEKQLNNAFSDKTINRDLLAQYIQDIEHIRAKLRFVHLSTHLQTPNILTEEQIDLYNRLRGYSNDPCKHIPEGHNAEMWKKHNGCL